MTTPAAGWYPDPAGSGGTRWWDGVAWGDQIQPAPQPVAQPGAAPGQPWHVGQQGHAGQAPSQQWDAGQAAGQQWDGGQAAVQPWNPGGPTQQWTPQQAPATFAKRNTYSLIAAAVVVVCVLIAATTNHLIFAFFPAFFAVRAVQAKEPLAWPAVGIAVAVIIWRIAIWS